MKKNLFWFVAAGVLLVVSFIVESPYMAYAIWAFLLLVGLAHVSSLAWLSGLDCERAVNPTVLQQGEEAHVDVTVTNRRGWPIPWIFFEDYHPADFHRIGDNARLAILMPGRSVTLKYQLQCSRRGYHRIGPMLMESGDLFGLQKRFRSGKQRDYISVLPTVAYIDTFNIATKRPQGPVKVSNRIYEDPTRISGVREYVPGDPMNRIHWKASARTGQLYSKTVEPSSVLGATLILDLHRDSYAPERFEERTELAITTTASIAYLLQMSGEQVGMLTNAADAAEVAKYEAASEQRLSRDEAIESVQGEGESNRLSPLQVPTRRSPVQALMIIENLARVLPGDGLDIERLLFTQYNGLPRDAALLPVVPQVTDSFALLLAELKYSGFAVSVFFIADRKGFEEANHLLAPHNIHVFHIEHERNLHELNPAKIGV
jgi:uncharacterized protein (DUF58 family)